MKNKIEIALGTLIGIYIVILIAIPLAILDAWHRIDIVIQRNRP